jgi:hypothetical protein
MTIYTNVSREIRRGNSQLARVAALVLVVFLAGCAGGIPQFLRQSLTIVVPHDVDFSELDYYAKRAAAAYTPASEIRRNFPQTTRVTTLESIDVLYFVETDEQQKTQTISIRGTANTSNVWQDEDIAMLLNELLGINLHRGFHDDAIEIHADVKPYLKRDYSTRITGHSLGGAVAMVLAMFLVEDGFEVDRLVTFGQPKVTDQGGSNSVRTSITRVAHDKDVVPMIPPSGFFFEGSYQHVGPEVILRGGPEYVYLDTHDADRLSVGEFWRNIAHFSMDDHHMGSYLSNIEEKVRDGVRQVPYFGP